MLSEVCRFQGRALSLQGAPVQSAFPTCMLSFVGTIRAQVNMTFREVDTTLNPRVAALKSSKTMALTDLASSMQQKGIDVVGLAAGEPDFDTPAQILDAGIEALR